MRTAAWAPALLVAAALAGCAAPEPEGLPPGPAECQDEHHHVRLLRLVQRGDTLVLSMLVENRAPERIVFYGVAAEWAGGAGLFRVDSDFLGPGASREVEGVEWNVEPLAHAWDALGSNYGLGDHGEAAHRFVRCPTGGDGLPERLLEEA